MKKKIFALLALVCMTLTASAEDVPTYSLTKADGAEAHGTIAFTVDGQPATSAAEGKTVTVTITPATGWVVNKPEGQWYAAIAAIHTRSGIDLLNKVEFTPVANTENQWTFTMARANVEIGATYKKLLTNTDITIDDIAALTYTGVAQTPAVTVKDGSTAIVLNTDYTVSYSNNVNAALSTAENAPTVTITAVATSEKYAGETTKTFTIQPKALTVTAEDKTATYGDAAPTYTVSYNGFVNNETNAVLGGTLAFDCPYVQNESVAGEYTITPSGLTSNNYEITFTAGKLTVGKKALTADMIAAIADQIYNGQALTPTPVVTFNGMTLVEGEDYTVAYSNNLNVGTATVTITAVETSKKYAGSTTKTFTILRSSAVYTAPEGILGLVYNGEEQELIIPGVTPIGGYMVYSLNSNSDFTSSIPTRVDAGGYNVYWYVVGDGNMYGTDKMSIFVTIAPKPAEDVKLKFEVTADGKLKIGDGDLDMMLGKDFTLVILDSEGKVVDLGDALKDIMDANANQMANLSIDLTQLNLPDGNYTAIFTLIGNYEGTLEHPFTIKNGTITGISTVNSQQPTANSYYDLSGRRIANGQQPTAKGLYIHNGRKIVVK